jgi:hypothetical protein
VRFYIKAQMSDVVPQVIPWIILGGLGLYAISVVEGPIKNTSSVLGEITTSVGGGVLAESRASEAIKDFSSREGEPCILDKDCIGGTVIGGTSLCTGGVCVPKVAEHGIGRIRFSANELGLKKKCGHYVLLGIGSEADSVKQCAYNGKPILASDPTAISGTAFSPVEVKNGKCALKNNIFESWPTYVERVRIGLEDNKKFMEDHKNMGCDDYNRDINYIKSLRPT